jgi:threonyl-tRNA synthetase
MGGYSTYRTKELYVTSGWYEKYSTDGSTYTYAKEEEFLLKPMNCPHHCEIYNMKTFQLPRGYKDMLGTVWNLCGQSGEL